MKPREATKEEKSELAFYVAEQMGGFESNDNMEQAKGFVEQSAIAVFDHYITDCPGYAGKVMSVVWSGSPDFYEVFIWDRNSEMKHINQDSSFVAKTEEEPF
jgi:hypothetical protein